jgi:hypothetical protein
MKNNVTYPELYLFFLLAGLLFVATPAYAQQRANDEARPSPNATVSQTVGTTEVTITYGRPGVKGRQIFGELEPYGKVWRAGANEATTFSISTDISVEGKPLPAGTYGLFMIPGEQEWTVIFNKVPNQWGAFRYDEAQDALRVTVKPEAAPHSELLTYSFDEVSPDAATASLRWAEVRVPFRLTVN